MGMWLKKILCIVGILIPLQAQSYIYEVKVLRKWNQQNKKYHYFIGLSDFHDKTHAAGQQQLADLVSCFGQAERANIKVVLEDLSSCGSNGRNSCGRFYVDSKGGVLGGLATTFRDMGFDVDNIEYRYCRVASLGPILNNVQQKPHVFPSVATTQVSMLATEVDAIAQEIGSYTDGHKLKTVYNRGLKQINNQLNHFKACQQMMNVADYIEQNSTASNRLEFIKRLLTFDSCLLDLKMTHAVVNAPGYDKVVAIAGGAHIGRVSELLEKIGYEVVHTTHVKYKKECDLAKCLGSTVVDGAYCIRPEPIMLDRVHKYL